MSTITHSENTLSVPQGFVSCSPLELTSTDALRILLIEDSHADALLTKRALEHTGIPFTLSTLTSGNEVLMRPNFTCFFLPTEKPDLILLDLGLPGMDGFEVLSEMAKLPASIREIPIVILTAYQNFEYLRSTYPSLHVLGYLNKPCDPEVIHPMLVQVLMGREPALL